MDIHEQLMRRCFQLAANGLGHVRPNPMVGCVVVKDGRIVSEGFHQYYGGNHAERNALLPLVNGEAEGADLYVNLEPCSHYGKTPPCADLIVQRGIKRVFCSNDDPNPKVAGGGFDILRRAGVSVVNHILESEGRWLNRRFFTFMESKRPYVILKWAQSADGFLAPEPLAHQNGCGEKKQYWLSTQCQNRLNHRWRTEEAAILIGSETFLCDNPQLSPRHYLGPAPCPVVLDRRGRISSLPDGWVSVNCQTIPMVMERLYDLRLQSVIVEGGREVLNAFINAGIYDEIRILQSKSLLYAGTKAPDMPHVPNQRVMVVNYE